MSTLWVILCALCVILCVIYAEDYGRGLYDPISIEKCEEPGHKFKYDLELFKINSTHAGVKGHIVSEEVFTKDFGVRLEIYRKVGEETKFLHSFYDDCLIDFLNKYAEDDVRAFLIAGGVDPPTVPIEKGDYYIDNFIFEKRSGIGVNGTLSLKKFLMEGEVEVGCLKLIVEFNQFED